MKGATQGITPDKDDFLRINLPQLKIRFLSELKLMRCDYTQIRLSH